MDNAEIARKLMGVFGQFRRTMKGPPPVNDVKPSEVGLLFMIKNRCGEEPQGMKVSDLSARMHVTSPSVTQMVTALEERGLVRRTMDRGDRRSVLVSLTEKGNEITEKAEKHFMEMLTALVDHLGPEKSLQLADIMQDVFVYFEKLSEKHGAI